MDFGSFILTWALVPLALSMAGYFLVAVAGNQYRLSARAIYWILLGMIVAAFVQLLILFLTDKFQYSYVSSYSSRDLSNTFPHFFKLSALWAGQQGTFVLWLLFGLLLGLWVKSRAKENEGWVMFFYILGQAFLLVLAIVSKPFEKLSFIPTDGQGLNPLLQNYWMQIHPPIVFIGFAAACIPFAFAMAALATNKYDNWVRQTMPWAVFSVVTLGLGIFLGGYWAYETLGWGGYWAWDPVENASAIPWMVGIALVHGMVIERSRGSWRRMNLFLAITLFLLIVYGTFLTRSGVLADFSVHSFVDLGYNNILWASIIVLGLVSYGLWAIRFAKIKGAAPGNDVLSQEFTTFLAVALLLPFTLLVLFWTSFPLITTIFSKVPLLSKITPTPAAIDTSYYNMAGLIFSTIFAIILGFNALLFWKKIEASELLKKIRLPVILSIIGALLFTIIGYSRIVELWSGPDSHSVSLKVLLMLLMYFLFFAAALFSFIANIIYLARHRIANWRSWGGYLAHIGFSLLLMGIILSSSFGSRTKLTLQEGQARDALGYSVTYTGNETVSAKEERSNFGLEKSGKAFTAYSVSKEMRRGRELQYVRTPFIKKYLFSDLYLSLENMIDGSDIDMKPFKLAKGGTATIAGNTITFAAYDSEENARKLAKAQPRMFELAKGKSFTIDKRQVKFIKFDMGQHQQGASSIGAVLEVEFDGKTENIVPIYEPLSTGEHRSTPVGLPGGGTIALNGIRADVGSVNLAYSTQKEPPMITLGTMLVIISAGDTSIANPVFNPVHAHDAQSVSTLADGSQLFLVEIDAANDSASFVLVPGKEPSLATIEISTKPMINLVWFGFLIIVAGSGLAVFKRMKESKIKE